MSGFLDSIVDEQWDEKQRAKLTEWKQWIAENQHLWIEQQRSRRAAGQPEPELGDDSDMEDSDDSSLSSTSSSSDESSDDDASSSSSDSDDDE